MTRRITVEEVVEAYRVTGLKPAKTTAFYKGKKSAGVIGVLQSRYRKDDVWEFMDSLGAEYAHGLKDGWTKAEFHKHLVGDKRYDRGYRDGMKAAAAVFGKDTP